VDADTLPQTVAVIRTRAEPLGIEVVVADLYGSDAGLPVGDFFGVLLAYPGASGAVRDHEAAIAKAHEHGAIATVAADLLALTLIKSPGELGADIAIGSAQRFGVPMGFGGPHAAYMSTKTEHARKMPGRIIGVSKDSHGNPAYRLAIQTREQHIRREKATSNVCTNQGLFALRATIYLSLLGPQGLRETANLCLQKSRYAAEQLCAPGATAGSSSSAQSPGATGSASASSAPSTSSTSISGRFQLAFPTPAFKEFVIRDRQNRVDELLHAAVNAGFLAGVPLGQWYPDLKDCFLVAVTEKRTRHEIDSLVKTLASTS